MIEMKDICLRRGNFNLRNITASFGSGKFHALLGPSGSGKSLLLETLAGLQTPDSGEIFIQNIPATNLNPEMRGFAYLPQDNLLFPHFSVEENIGYGLKLNGNLNPQQIINEVNQVAAILKIDHLIKRKPHGLSGGERQRVGLARALAKGSSLLLLDEPVSALQESLQEDFCLLLRDIQREFNLTLLMTTHNRDSAFLTADELHFIADGQLALSIEKGKLPGAPLPLSVAEIIGVSNIFSLQKTGEKEWFCPQTASIFNFSGLTVKTNLRDNKLKIGVRPADIRLVVKEEKPEKQKASTEIISTFSAVIDRIYNRERETLVLLTIAETGFSVKMEISRYNALKHNLLPNSIVSCRIRANAVHPIMEQPAPKV